MCVSSIFKAIGGLFGGGQAPTVQALPTPPEAPKDVDPSVQRARSEARRRAASAKGFGSTLLDPNNQLADPILARTTLMGNATPITL